MASLLNSLLDSLTGWGKFAKVSGVAEEGKKGGRIMAKTRLRADSGVTRKATSETSLTYPSRRVLSVKHSKKISDSDFPD